MKEEENRSTTIEEVMVECFNHRFPIYQMSAGGQEAAVQAGDPS